MLEKLTTTSLLRLLEDWREERLQITLPDGSQYQLGEGSDEPMLHWHFHSTKAIRELLLGGDIGLGESYTAGRWDCNDLPALLRALIRHRVRTARELPWYLEAGSQLVGSLNRFRHYLRRNTRRGSAENISRHYDLGNTLYQHFLDPSLTYSSAYFRYPGQNLERAQQEKYDRIAGKLGLSAGMHVLEIGTGWGGFALHAARHYGCQVTTTTISKEQHRLALERVREAGLSEQIDCRLSDYRDLEGRFDRIVSIEMLEAVGHDYLPTFFEHCEKLLAPGGLLGLQVILCPDSRYEEYRTSSDWIRKHVFPGGHLPSLNAIQEAMAGAGEHHLLHLENFGWHYAETLRQWRERFNANWEAIRPHGYDETFHRLWNLYLAYCEAGFEEHHIQVAQLVFGRVNELGYRFDRPAALERIAV